jgi:hypothetical protein
MHRYFDAINFTDQIFDVKTTVQHYLLRRENFQRQIETDLLAEKKMRTTKERKKRKQDRTARNRIRYAQE